MRDNFGIQFENVSFQIGSFKLKDISFVVKKGEYFVLTGPNGAGKTTIIRIIAGLEYPTLGDVFLNGYRMADTPPWQRNIGYLPQDGILFPNRTVRGNIIFPLEVRGVKREKIMEKLIKITELTGVTHLLDRMPYGLSAGERQKVTLARALIAEPSILLLDEPVSAIDEGIRDSMCIMLRNIQQELKITTLHVSHNSHETSLVADRVAYLADGVLSVPSSE